jgi:hypothetical protein
MMPVRLGGLEEALGLLPTEGSYLRGWNPRRGDLFADVVLD